MPATLRPKNGAVQGGEMHVVREDMYLVLDVETERNNICDKNDDAMAREICTCQRR